MRRIAVVGSGGAGKTTFAHELGRRTGIPVVSLDEFYWRPGWCRPDRRFWRKRQEQLLSRDAWIVDGNYWSTLDIRLSRADTVIILDQPRWVCLMRVLRRNCWYYGKALQAAPGLPRTTLLGLPALPVVLFSPAPATSVRLDRYALDQVILLWSNRNTHRFLAAM